MKLYSEDTSSNFISSKYLEIRSRIESESENYILSVGETQYIEYLKNQYHINFPEIHTDKVYVDTYEMDVPASRFPIEFMILERNKSFKKDIIVYHIPYTGNINLLRFRPNMFSSQIGNELQFDTESQTIKFEFINFYNDPAQISREYNESLNGLFSCYNYLKQEIESYNNGLEAVIQSNLSMRRQRLLKKNDFISSLGVPVKKNLSTPRHLQFLNPYYERKSPCDQSLRKKDLNRNPLLTMIITVKF